jgi:hypothetical protein
VLLETGYEDGGLADTATVWRYLGRKPIIVGKSSLVVASAGDPLRADLAGDVTITVAHADRLLARATITGLTLARKDASDPDWFLPEDEVERTARAAGLRQAVSPESIWPWWIALATFAILCLSLWWFARRHR